MKKNNVFNKLLLFCLCFMSSNDIYLNLFGCVHIAHYYYYRLFICQTKYEHYKFVISHDVMLSFVFISVAFLFHRLNEFYLMVFYKNALQQNSIWKLFI